MRIPCTLCGCKDHRFPQRIYTCLVRPAFAKYTTEWPLIYYLRSQVSLLLVNHSTDVRNAQVVSMWLVDFDCPQAENIVLLLSVADNVGISDYSNSRRYQSKRHCCGMWFLVLLLYSLMPTLSATEIESTLLLSLLGFCSDLIHN